MKRLLRKGFCLALGFTTQAASAQELNFRAVAPRPAVNATTEIPFTLNRPTPLDASMTPVFRAKAPDDPIAFGPLDASKTELVRFQQIETPRLSPVPAGGPPFAPPPPQMVAPSAGHPYVGSKSETSLFGPTVSGPDVPGPVVSGPMTTGPIVSGPIVAGPMSTSGCVCTDGDLFNGFYNGSIGDDACGMACSTCDASCHPLHRLRDVFSCNWCNSGCCDPRTPFWVRGEYLLWNATRQHVPPLATQAATVVNLPLAPGNVNTILYDDGSISSAALNGGRIAAGFWFPRHSDWGLDASYFFLGDRSSQFSSSSNGSFAIGRPYVEDSPFEFNNDLVGASSELRPNRFQGLPLAQIVASDPSNETGPVPGSIAIDANTRVWGFDANLRHKLCCGPGFWIDGLIGYRHLQVEDTISINEAIGRRVYGDGSIVNRTLVSDSFGARNAFNGAQLGIEGEYRFRPRFTLGGSFKLALGAVHQTVGIDGSTTISGATFAGQTFAGSATQAGGLLAQPTNIGQHSSNRFAIVPELGVKIGWDITPHWRFYAGYNIVYLSNVVRAGEQIDTRVNTSQAAFSGFRPQGAPIPSEVTRTGAPGVLYPGSPATPAVLFRTSEFWAQGVSLGLEYRY